MFQIIVRSTGDKNNLIDYITNNTIIIDKIESLVKSDKKSQLKEVLPSMINYYQGLFDAGYVNG